jgi:SagB-type dehydrogenase family enzyme
MLAVVLLCSVSSFAEDLKPVKLSAPTMKGGGSLMEALKERKSTRAYTEEKVSMDVLSNLLWAAFGINRPDEGKRTAPSAMNWQEIDIYVALEEGLYVYNATGHTLEPVLGEDVRAMTGMQPFVGRAPVNLVFVADYTRIKEVPDNLREFYSAADAGFISQNVYLFCASEGLGTVVRGLIDREELTKTMELKPDQKIVLAQSIGHPQPPKGEPGIKR